MSLTHETTLPSGTRVVVRAYTARELDAVTSKRRDAEALTALLDACVVSHEVVGPPRPPHPPGPRIVEEDEGRSWPSIYPADRIDWSAAPVGDRHCAKLALRAATYPGVPYVPRLRCPVRTCRSPIEAEFLVEEVLAQNVVPFPRETLEKLAAGDNRFEHRLGSVVVASRLMDGAASAALEAKLARLADGQAGLVAATAARIHDVRVGERHLKLRSEVEDWLGDCPYGLFSQLLERMDAVDGGLETAASVRCGECGWADDVDLPFSGSEFWSPVTPRKRASWAARAQGAPRASSEE